MEYLVRAARIVDIDRIVALCGGRLGASGADGGGPIDAADLLRQLVFLPQATVLVAEARREVAGAAVLTLRPSVRAGGFVGTVDLLAIADRPGAEEIADMLVGEVLRSAANKACALVEVSLPHDSAEQAVWDRNGFREGSAVLTRNVAHGVRSVRSPSSMSPRG